MKTREFSKELATYIQTYKNVFFGHFYASHPKTYPSLISFDIFCNFSYIALWISSLRWSVRMLMEVYLKKISTLMKEVDGLNCRWYYVTTMSARRLKILSFVLTSSSSAAKTDCPRENKIGFKRQHILACMGHLKNFKSSLNVFLITFRFFVP